MVSRKMQLKNDNKNEEDFISDLSDCILLHTLSFLNAKEAVQTCILSKRWINLWKTLPTLKLSSSNFRTCTSFDQFLSQIFSLRDHSSAIHALSLHNNHFMGIRLYKKIIEYTFSHNVQRFRINYNNIQHHPPCFFSSHTLTSLHLSSCSMFRSGSTQIFPNSFNFPALTTLSLERLAFRCGTSDDDGCVNPFSTFNMLNTLIIDCCVLLDAQNLRISSTKLLNLTICMYDSDPRNNFRSSFGIELYAPTVHTFDYSGGEYIPNLFGSKSALSSIKHVNIDLLSFRRNKASILLCWLVELANIESLTANSAALMDLLVFPDLLNVKLPSLLCNLKSLKLKLFQPWEHAKLVDFLLQNSPSAKVEFSKSLL